jgi:hypothetical protein
MELNRLEAQIDHVVNHILASRVHEYAYNTNEWANGVNNVVRKAGGNTAGGLCENQADRAGPGFHGNVRIIHAGDATDFHARHERSIHS